MGRSGSHPSPVQGAPAAADGAQPAGDALSPAKGALLSLAAEAKLTTPASERWIVLTDDAGNEIGYVYVELSERSDAEVKRGLALLKRSAG